MGPAFAPAPLAEQHVGQVEGSLPVVGGQGHGLAQAGFGLAIGLGGELDDPQVGPGTGVFRVPLQQGAADGLGFVETALVGQQGR